ncbi:Major royal jelly protein 2 [Anthophora quadrimaculata]
MLSWCSLLLCLNVLSQDVTAGWFRATNKENKLEVTYEWKYMDFLYDSEQQREAAIKSGEYVPASNSPIDVDRWNKETFVTIIRSKGVPSSLNTISDQTGNGGPLLKPYPDWSWTNTSNCDGITSVYRVAIDRCDRLWVLDNGVIDDVHTCPAQLLTFDLNTSNLLKRVKIPDNIARNSTTGKGLLVTPVVQTFGPDCRHTNVFMADVDGYALIIYDGQSLRRVTSSSLVYDPKATNYTIEGQSFELQDGPVGMALSTWTGMLYFSPMSSRNLVAVSSQGITLPESGIAQFRSYNDILTTQASAKAISKTGALFFGLVNNTSIGCWNEFKSLNRNNIDIAAKNRTTLQFTSGLKVKDTEEGEVLLAFTNRYQKLATGTLNTTDVNFRILTGRVKDLIENTKCQPRIPLHPGFIL